ncbi:hypothetical protein Sgou_17090 [Streptomyces gougerotii]|uniref:Uncharacterized protein n=2 Tax=Streptomyces diastaticus group TaxID=2849069 RepID=A0A8H9LQR5_9ACTN|nr:hypothetical protein Srut_00800 [Streptomyces rutgersensis]GFH74731.1 hypothetical protein Sdia_54990 [Streptomyces diastaticus subsp. diastaticus]GFH77039.1 hypothetical protein Sgou_17090 [Streptomyces gougerotii]GGU04968.1 hypothetical protein GCM10015534_03680 [Streptomyces diastaticus subsp. diastaticus]GGU66583.1 hypothetical protein GCM10010227_20390 [Streptomyces gougerotii]
MGRATSSSGTGTYRAFPKIGNEIRLARPEPRRPARRPVRPVGQVPRAAPADRGRGSSGRRL